MKWNTWIAGFICGVILEKIIIAIFILVDMTIVELFPYIIISIFFIATLIITYLQIKIIMKRRKNNHD